MTTTLTVHGGAAGRRPLGAESIGCTERPSLSDGGDVPARRVFGPGRYGDDGRRLRLVGGVGDGALLVAGGRRAWLRHVRRRARLVAVPFSTATVTVAGSNVAGRGPVAARGAFVVGRRGAWLALARRSMVTIRSTSDAATTAARRAAARADDRERPRDGAGDLRGAPEPGAPRRARTGPPRHGAWRGPAASADATTRLGGAAARSAAAPPAVAGRGAARRRRRRYGAAASDAVAAARAAGRGGAPRWPASTADASTEAGGRRRGARARGAGSGRESAASRRPAPARRRPRARAGGEAPRAGAQRRRAPAHGGAVRGRRARGSAATDRDLGRQRSRPARTARQPRLELLHAAGRPRRPGRAGSTVSRAWAKYSSTRIASPMIAAKPASAPTER